jgi:hypothetical protein
MELSKGLLKSIDSGYYVVTEGSLYALRYKGKLFFESGNVRLFKTTGAAKTALTNFVKQCFWHGQYWQSCSTQIKNRTGYDVDFSATIAMLDSYGKTSIFDSAESKKLFKEISNALLEQGIFTIEQV